MSEPHRIDDDSIPVRATWWYHVAQGLTIACKTAERERDEFKAELSLLNARPIEERDAYLEMVRERDEARTRVTELEEALRGLMATALACGGSAWWQAYEAAKAALARGAR